MTAAAGPRVMWIGTYERDYPRTRVLADGLSAAGAEVIELHRPLWELTTHKAGAYLSPRRVPRLGARFAAAWISLGLEQRTVDPPDAVIAGYPAQPDALPAWLCARRHRAPLVVDAMISLSDTLTGDRARVGRAAAAVLDGLDGFAARRADLLITDTRAHADFFADRFQVSRDRIAAIPVGADPGLFRRTPAPDGPVRAVFYGKLSPLHGLETILEASRTSGVPPLRLIGDGQLGGWLERELRRAPPPGVEWVRWVPYESLGRELGTAAICLGIFGTSAKAGRVVPNKVYQAMAVGRPIVTADTAAAREVLTDGEHALLVPAGDAEALADAMRRLAAEPDLRGRLSEGAHRRFLELGTPAAVAARFLASLSTVRASRSAR